MPRLLWRLPGCSNSTFPTGSCHSTVLPPSEYALIVSTRRAAGAPISQLDAQIAAIARSRGAAVATRDVGGFAGCGIEVINPWRA